MEKKKTVIIFLAVFLSLLGISMALIVMFSSTNASKEEETSIQTDSERETEVKEEAVMPYEETERSSEEKDKQDMQAVLSGFADTIYNYDTSDRMFYEGCEQYMTDEAYLNFAPLSDPEEKKNMEEEPITVVSSLVSMISYERIISETEVEIMMEAIFTTAASGENQTYQLMKLSLVKNEENWKISHTKIVDTIEQ